MENQSYRKFITTKYGDEAYKTIQEYQSALRLEKIINEDIYFLSKCKKRDLIPVHCKLGGRRSVSPVTRKLLKNTERKLLNRSIVKNYSKCWKQRNKLKNINEKLEVLSVKDYIGHEIKTHKKLNKLMEVKKKKLEHKFNKMLDTNAKDNFNISQKDKEAHIQRTVLNFSQVEISGVGEAMENISATYIKNSFRVECLSILKRGRSNDQINCNEKICRKIRTWLKDNKLMVMETDEGRATCIIQEEKVNKMIETELNNQNKCHSFKKDNIDNVRSKSMRN